MVIPLHNPTIQYDTSQILYEVIDCHQASASQFLQVPWSAQQILGAPFSRDGFFHDGDDLYLQAEDRVLVLSGWSDLLDKPYLLTADGKSLNGDILRALDRNVLLSSITQTSKEGVAIIDQITGEAWVTNTHGDRVVLSQNSILYQGNVIETGSGTHVRIRFVDEAVVTLGSKARFAINDLYGASSDVSTMILSVLKGAFTFVSGLVARDDPENVRIFTPTTEIGIRGTKIVGEVDDNGELKVVLIEGRIFVADSRGSYDISIPLQGFDSSAPGRQLIFSGMRDLVQSFPAVFPDQVAQQQFLQEQAFTQGFEIPELKVPDREPAPPSAYVQEHVPLPSALLSPYSDARDKTIANDDERGPLVQQSQLNFPPVRNEEPKKIGASISSNLEPAIVLPGTIGNSISVSPSAPPGSEPPPKTVYSADDVQITDVTLSIDLNYGSATYYISFTAPTGEDISILTVLYSTNYDFSPKKVVLSMLATESTEFYEVNQNFVETPAEQIYVAQDYDTLPTHDFSAYYRVYIFVHQFPFDSRFQGAFSTTPVEVIYNKVQQNDFVNLGNQETVNDLNGIINHYRADVHSLRDWVKIIDHNDFRTLEYYQNLLVNSKNEVEIHTDKVSLDIKVDGFNLVIKLDSIIYQDTIKVYLDGDLEQYISQFYTGNKDADGNQLSLNILFEDTDASVSKVKVILYSDIFRPYAQNDIDVTSTAQQIKSSTAAPIVLDDQNTLQEAYITVQSNQIRPDFLDFEIRT